MQSLSRQGFPVRVLERYNMASYYMLKNGKKWDEKKHPTLRAKYLSEAAPYDPNMCGSVKLPVSIDQISFSALFQPDDAIKVADEDVRVIPKYINTFLTFKTPPVLAETVTTEVEDVQDNGMVELTPEGKPKMKLKMETTSRAPNTYQRTWCIQALKYASSTYHALSMHTSWSDRCHATANNWTTLLSAVLVRYYPNSSASSMSNRRTSTSRGI